MNADERGYGAGGQGGDLPYYLVRCSSALRQCAGGVLVAVQFGMGDCDFPKTLLHDFARRLIPVASVIEARGLKHSRVSPPVQNDPCDVLCGVEARIAEQERHLRTDLPLEI